jgi:hypothetical protein
MAASEVKAGTFEITVSVLDVTTNTLFAFAPVTDGSTNDTNPSTSMIDVTGAFSTASSGVSLTGLHADFSSGAAMQQSALNLLGIAEVGGANGSGLTDTYLVTIMATNTGFAIPTTGPAILGQSTVSTFTNTTGAAGDGTTLNAYYDPANATNSITAFTSPGQSISEPSNVGGTPLSPPALTSPSTTTIATAAYKTPFSLTDVVTLTITGNGSGTIPATNQFEASATIKAAAIPEPASIVMFLTGMPVPLVILGILRRRKALAKN